MRTVTLPYGAHPRVARVPDDAVVIELPIVRPAGELHALLEDALDVPIGAPPLRAGGRAVVVVSDATRHEPRSAMVAAVLARLGTARLTIAVANGTHRPGEPRHLGLADAWLQRAEVINHDARAWHDLVQVGTSRRGTPMWVNRCLVEADQIIATGRIKPHYFAGFSAGAKALFPGLGENDAIRVNHRLKQHRDARAGVVDGNPCREDLEEIVDMLPVQPFLLNVVTDATGHVRAAVAGDMRAAFRAGCRACATLFRVDMPEADVIVVSDELPLVASLYQASKLVAAVASRLRPGGHIVLVAQCPDGVGPVDVVNEGIYRIGLAPRLPRDHTVHLVSDLDPAVVRGSYCRPARSVEAVIEQVSPRRVVVAPRAGDLLVAR